MDSIECNYIENNLETLEGTTMDTKYSFKTVLDSSGDVANLVN